MSRRNQKLNTSHYLWSSSTLAGVSTYPAGAFWAAEATAYGIAYRVAAAAAGYPAAAAAAAAAA